MAKTKPRVLSANFTVGEVAMTTGQSWKTQIVWTCHVSAVFLAAQRRSTAALELASSIATVPGWHAGTPIWCYGDDPGRQVEIRTLSSICCWWKDWYIKSGANLQN